MPAPSMLCTNPDRAKHVGSQWFSMTASSTVTLAIVEPRLYETLWIVLVKGELEGRVI